MLTGRGGATSESRGAGSSQASGPVYEYRRLQVAGCSFRRIQTADECVDETPLQLDVPCPDGSARLDPLFRRPLTGGDWETVDMGCPETAPEIIALSVEEFRRLPLAPSTPSYQPADGRGLVGMPLIVFTDPAPQQLTTTVLGVPVTVRATPTRFAWDFGDGSPPLVTEDPGAPYPDHSVSHPYLSTGAFTVRLTTTWRGEFQVAGTAGWQPVAGTATTTSEPFAATVEEALPRLVSRP